LLDVLNESGLGWDLLNRVERGELAECAQCSGWRHDELGDLGGVVRWQRGEDERERNHPAQWDCAQLTLSNDEDKGDTRSSHCNCDCQERRQPAALRDQETFVEDGESLTERRDGAAVGEVEPRNIDVGSLPNDGVPGGFLIVPFLLCHHQSRRADIVFGHQIQEDVLDSRPKDIIPSDLVFGSIAIEKLQELLDDFGILAFEMVGDRVGRRNGRVGVRSKLAEGRQELGVRCRVDFLIISVTEVDLDRIAFSKIAFERDRGAGCNKFSRSCEDRDFVGE